MCLEHTSHLEAAIARLDERVDAVFTASTAGQDGEGGVPLARARDRLDSITGVGKRAAATIIAEIGVDMTRFPTTAHLASWAGVAPGNNITGGERGSGTTTKGDVWLIDILTQCAWAAAHTRDTYLSAQFWRLARRIGKKKAAVAVAHSILVICPRGLRNVPPGHPRRTGHSHHPEMTTGERYASKGARTVREGADGKGPEPRAPRRRPTSLGGRARETDPGQPGHRARVRPNRSTAPWSSRARSQHGDLRT